MLEFDVNDPRTPCKYGTSCYQKNKTHTEKYKHPYNVQDKICLENPTKKIKTDFDTKKTLISSTNEDKNILTSNREVAKIKETKRNVSPNNVLLKDKIRTDNSKKVELQSNCKELIKQLFLFDMPDDFYSFWEMCESICKSNPIDALKAVKLKLVGPFDVLAGNINEVYEEDLPDFLRHWRFYYDPPEFQTVLVKEGSSCFHFGYYRDDPRENPVFVASNQLNLKNPEKNGDLKIVGENLFAAVNGYLEDLKTDPFSRMKIPTFQKILTSWAKEKGFSLQKKSKSRHTVAKTFHGAGIVVPVDKKNDVGYRELAAPNSMIKKMLKGIVDSETEEERNTFWEQLQPVITFANIANDECDFGTSLELGLDLFTYGSPLLHRTACQLLTTAYNLLGRTEFSQIIEAHLSNRRQGPNVSIL